METATFDTEALIEQTHWWFVGRRRLFASELERMGVSRVDRILDVGTGTGSNLRMLRDKGYGNVVGLDFDPVAARYCAEKGLGQVELGSITAMPFADGSFEVVIATDVIEHIDDDAQALDEVRRVLAPGGRALITVPAFSSLWGLQDKVAHHKRRYRSYQLVERITRAGMHVEWSYYFNYILFVPIWIARQVIAARKLQLNSENEINSPLANRFLTAIFALDVCTAPWLRPPFGVSFLVFASKR